MRKPNKSDNHANGCVEDNKCATPNANLLTQCACYSNSTAYYAISLYCAITESRADIEKAYECRDPFPE